MKLTELIERNYATNLSFPVATYEEKTKKVSIDSIYLRAVNDHKTIVRGKDLTTKDGISSEQGKYILSGSFKDMYLNDYWIIDGIKWTIVDFNYFPEPTRPEHLVLMADKPIGFDPWDGKDYENSKIGEFINDWAKEKAEQFIGTSPKVISYYAMSKLGETPKLISGVRGLIPSGPMILGNNGSIDPLYSCSDRQFALFKQCPELVNTLHDMCLREGKYLSNGTWSDFGRWTRVNLVPIIIL